MIPLRLPFPADDAYDLRGVRLVYRLRYRLGYIVLSWRYPGIRPGHAVYTHWRDALAALGQLIADAPDTDVRVTVPKSSLPLG